MVVLHVLFAQAEKLSTLLCFDREEIKSIKKTQKGRKKRKDRKGNNLVVP
jgi:hypothetical protein